MALTQISTQGIKDGTITGSDLATNIDLVDNQKLRLGTGNDLQIYHDSTNSIIDNDTAALILRSDQFRFRDKDDGDTFVNFIHDGAVDLYHDNTKKFETTANGATLFGYLNVGSGTSNWGFLANDSTKIGLGTSQDLTLQHDGTDSIIANATGDLYINNTGGNSDDVHIQAADDILLRPQGGENGIKVIGNGAVELYHNNIKTFETVANGIIAKGTEGADAYVYIFADEADNVAVQYWLKTAADGTGIYIQNYVSGSSETNLRAVGNGAVELYYDNSLRFETTANGVEVEGSGTDAVIANFKAALGSNNRNLSIKSPASDSTTVPFLFSTSNSIGFEVDNVECLRIGSADDILIPNDSSKLTFGSGQDLQIFHNGTDSRITDTGTGSLVIGGSAVFIQNAAHDENMIRALPDGAVDLYHNGTSKLATTTSGVAITGEAALTGGALKLDSHPLVSIANFTDISGGSYAARLGSTGSSTIRSTQIYGGGSHLATFDGVNVRLGVNTTTPDGIIHGKTAICKVISEGTNDTIAGIVASFDVKAAYYRKAGFRILDANDNEDLFMGSPYGTGDTNRTFVMNFHGTERFRFHADGTGLSFNGDTAAANALDDYEEGTYTPNVQTNNGVNAGVSTAFGSYVKVGTLVTVHIGVTTNSHSGVDTSAQYRVYLPFTAANQSGVGTEGNLICSQWSIGSQNISWMGGEVQNSFNFIYMHYHNGSNNNTNNLTPSAASNELHFRGTCVYRTAS